MASCKSSGLGERFVDRHINEHSNEVGISQSVTGTWREKDAILQVVILKLFFT